jgi:hypothetical protein
MTSCPDRESRACRAKHRCKMTRGAPIVAPALDASIGDNINGPSLIRLPDWITHPLGRYYLYFADHKGRHRHSIGQHMITKQLGQVQLPSSIRTCRVA